MNKKFLTLIAILFAFFITKAQGIEFDHDITFKDALKKAQKENKAIFIDAYTTWCGPCKMMSKEIFPIKEVGDFYNSKFINLKMDMEKGEGLHFAKEYQIKGYPTLIIINGEGEEIVRHLGIITAEELIKFGLTHDKKTYSPK